MMEIYTDFLMDQNILKEESKYSLSISSFLTPVTEVLLPHYDLTSAVLRNKQQGGTWKVEDKKTDKLLFIAILTFFFELLNVLLK